MFNIILKIMNWLQKKLYIIRNLVPLFLLILLSNCSPGWEIQNPYENINWDRHGQYKANFHTHTTRSDGRMNPQTVIDHYHRLGYNILAITDHNEVTYPWVGFSEMTASKTSLNRMESDPGSMPVNLVYEDRDPDALGMIDIVANELSRHHHMGSFFNDHNGTTTEEESLDATAAKNGIAMLYHPGRYTRSVEWYVNLYRNYDHLFGLEVYNQGDRYSNDRILWDSILTVTMPDRPVWGYSNDDMHSLPQLGRNWNMLILPELSSEWVRKGMEHGLSYFVYAPGGHDGPSPPIIESINVNKNRGTIQVNASGYESVEWISEGRVVFDGNRINLNEIEELGSYVRAKVYGPGETVAGTQPFGIKKP
jgi:hypothetical protein